MQARHETLDDRAREQLERADAREQLGIEKSALASSLVSVVGRYRCMFTGSILYILRILATSCLKSALRFRHRLDQSS